MFMQPSIVALCFRGSVKAAATVIAFLAITNQAHAMGTRPSDYDTFDCTLDGHTFRVPLGYVRFGSALLTCHPAMHQLSFNAYKPDLMQVPSDRIRNLTLEERLPIQVVMSANTQYENENKGMFLEHAKKSNDKLKYFSDRFIENQSYYSALPEAISLRRKRRLFYYLGHRDITHIITCGLYKNRDGGECSGSFSYNGVDVDYRYGTTSNKPELDISEQSEALIKALYVEK